MTLRQTLTQSFAVSRVCVKNDADCDAHLLTECDAVSSTMEKGRLNPTIPGWLIEEIQADLQQLGKGSRVHGGAQSLVMTALMLYLSLPQGDRLRLARMITARDRDSVMRDFQSHWIPRVVHAVGVLGEDYSESLVGAARAQERKSHSGGKREARRA